MRSLAVRVSTSIKSDAIKKSAEIRVSPLELPSTSIFQVDLEDAGMFTFY